MISPSALSMTTEATENHSSLVMKFLSLSLKLNNFFSTKSLHNTKFYIL